MDLGGELAGERLVDEALAGDSGLAGKSGSDDGDGEVGFAAGLRTLMADMAVRTRRR